MGEGLLLDLSGLGVDSGVGIVVLKGVKGTLVVLHVTHILYLNTGS